MNRYLIKIWLVATTVLLVTTTSQLSATSVLPLNLGDLCAFCSRIVIGKVESARINWNADKTMIFTIYQFQVAKMLKGEPVDEQIEITLPSGTIDSIEISIPGIPILHVGDQLLLFLSDLPNGKTTVEGLTQGVFQVVADAQGNNSLTDYFDNPVMSVEGEEIVVLRSETNVVSDSGGQLAPVNSNGIHHSNGMSLDAFLQSVETNVSIQRVRGYQGQYKEFLHNLMKTQGRLE